MNIELFLVHTTFFDVSNGFSHQPFTKHGAFDCSQPQWFLTFNGELP
ncbi:MAG: hypothetical protein K9N21_22760 [Deltaproteobacteria bacterium]|nr:hypothetical protein [Deltaproteobacteria bacterium]